MSVRHPLLLVFALLAGLLAACGGGGGDADVRDDEPTVPIEPLAIFSGDYAWASVFGNLRKVGAEVPTVFGGASADGAGLLTANLRRSVDGDVLDSPIGSLFPYEVAADRALRVLFSPSDPTPFFEGGVTADGRVAILSSVLEGGTPSVTLLLRKRRPTSADILDADFHVVGWVHQGPSGSGSAAVWGELESTGQGLSVLDIEGNSNGSISASRLETLHSVAPDGSLTLALNGGQAPTSLEGAVHASGEIAVATGATADGGPPICLCFLRKAEGATEALLSGDYHAVSFSHLPPNYASSVGTMTFDGVGSWAGTRVINQEGDLNPTGTEDGDYDVDPDGHLSLTIGAGFPFEGGVSASGDFAILAGSTVEGVSPQMWFLVRKGP